ncbi:F-box domain-containing protein, variant 2 [Balamuthia mandrillaris]
MDAPQLCQSLLSLSLPRLHTLELAGCASRFPPSVLGSLLRSLPQLSCLSLEGCKGVMKLGLLPIERSEGELPAEHLSSLCSLNLKGCPFVNNATLLEIAHCCPSLTSLSLAVCHRITDVGLYGLAGLIHDDVINVYAARDEEATSGTTRQVLPPRKIKGVPLLPKNTALVPPVGCRKLETLDLRGCFALSSHGLATCLAHQNRFPSLRCLNLGGNPNVDRHFMEALFGHEGQERPTLTSLSLRQCQRMTNRALAYLCNSAASCALVTLDLWACDKVTDILWTIHKLATHLTSLSKPYREGISAIDDAGMLAISAASYASTLQNLDIRQCAGVTDTGLRAIAEACASLQVLRLENQTGVSNEGVLYATSKLHQIRTLDLESLLINDLVLEQLACPLLEILSLQGCRGITGCPHEDQNGPEKKGGFCTLLLRCPALTILNLTRCDNLECSALEEAGLLPPNIATYNRHGRKLPRLNVLVTRGATDKQHQRKK